MKVKSPPFFSSPLSFFKTQRVSNRRHVTSRGGVGRKGKRFSRSHRRQFGFSRDCVNMGSALRKKMKKPKKRPVTAPPHETLTTTFNITVDYRDDSTYDNVDIHQKRYYPGDSSLRFVNREDEMDCKWSRRSEPRTHTQQ